MMQIATDETGLVRLTGNKLPTEWNGLKLTVHALTDEQEAAYKALPERNGGATFENGQFKALPAPPETA
jgi:hypothetical protein